MDASTLFQTDNVNCPISDYKVLTSSGNEYTLGDITFVSTNLVINLENPIYQPNLKIRAISSSGKFAELDLLVEVCGWETIQLA